MEQRLTFEQIMGSGGVSLKRAMETGRDFLDGAGAGQLLSQVGTTIESVPPITAIGKSALPRAYGGGQTAPSDDFLVGRGLFYLTEQRRLYLDLTSGHYQMLWGYRHPGIEAAIDEAVRTGVVWDNHSNIPQAPLKLLGQRLVEAANAPGEPDPLDTVLLGVCTGSVACAAALKIQLRVFEKERRTGTPPVLAVLDGNYHGTDMVPQVLRGMWPGLLRQLEVLRLPPNDPDALERAFRQHGDRMAGFWVEPVMMNREALALAPDYLRLAQQHCRQSGTLFCLDEIQTGFWQPEIFEYRRWGLQPDLVVLGKGMTAGFHPLSGVLFRRRHDVLAQYDAISTNGSAALPAYVALCSIELIRQQAAAIHRVGDRIHRGFTELAAEFPGLLLGAQGRRHLTGLKFRQVDHALEFHRRLIADGLWARVHAYHEGHSTILTKLGLLADDAIVDFVIARFREHLARLAPLVAAGPASNTSS